MVWDAVPDRGVLGEAAGEVGWGRDRAAGGCGGRALRRGLGVGVLALSLTGCAGAWVLAEALPWLAGPLVTRVVTGDWRSPARQKEEVRAGCRAVVDDQVRFTDGFAREQWQAWCAKVLGQAPGRGGEELNSQKH